MFIALSSWNNMKDRICLKIGVTARASINLTWADIQTPNIRGTILFNLKKIFTKYPLPLPFELFKNEILPCNLQNLKRKIIFFLLKIRKSCLRKFFSDCFRAVQHDLKFFFDKVEFFF